MNRQGSKQSLDATVVEDKPSPSSDPQSDAPLGDVLPLRQGVVPKPKRAGKRRRSSRGAEEDAALLKERLREMERKLQQLQETQQQLRSQLSEREEQVRSYKTHRAFEFAQELVDIKDEPTRVWRLPLAMARLVVPKSTRKWLGQTVMEPVRRASEYVLEFAVEQPLRHLPDSQVLVDGVTTFYRKVTQEVFGEGTGRERWPESRPLVSVIIPCFNYGSFLPDALVSLDKQTLQDFEIILVEGGSTDGTTTEQVRALRHPKVRKIFQSEPTRVGENRLAGLRQARGKYITFLDADDMLAPTYLEKAVMALELLGVDVVYPSVQLFGREQRVWETADEFSLANLSKTNTVSTVAMFRYETWKSLDIGYGSNKDGSIEDWDFWLRFAERGARGYKIREPLMLYRIHGNSLSDAIRPGLEQAYRKTLAKHRRYLGPLYVARVSREQTQPIKEAVASRDLSRSVLPARNPLRIALAQPWMVMGGSDSLMLQVFATCQQENARLTVYSSIETPPSMGSSSGAFQRLTDDVFELSKELPEFAHDEAILHLLRTRQVNVLMLVGSARTYALLPRIRRELPHVRVVDHLYNTVGHLANNRRHASEIDFHIVANEEVRDALLRDGESPERIRIIYHGIDMQRFSQESVPYLPGGPPGLEMAPGVRLVLYSGRFSEEKGVLRFVEIARRMRKDPRVRFAMTGDGPQRPEVEEFIHRHGLAERVKLLGIVEDSRPYLRRADVVVIPSDVEGLPLVCLESLALGTPVVASKVGALPEVIQSGRTGFVVPPTDVEGFVRDIRRALSLDTRRMRLARTCRDSVEERFSIETARQKYYEVFRQLASQGAASGVVQGRG
ncbi:glycosyltransferase [Archangium sp. Cb G35]|uniref:glycosyltransferase n=1 Tax=Archangium sp. Cb G35 TaxID=1920190 RepID=UPI000AECEB33|nr:glycosyltransferase [Archangium sp. Cb G35]